LKCTHKWIPPFLYRSLIDCITNEKNMHPISLVVFSLHKKEKSVIINYEGGKGEWKALFFVIQQS